MRIIVILSLLLSSCSIVTLTPEGSGIQLVETRGNCTYIGVVAGSNHMSSSAKDAEGAMNEVRNKAAEVSGNAIKILDIDSGDGTTTVVAEALSCPETD